MNKKKIEKNYLNREKMLRENKRQLGKEEEDKTSFNIYNIHEYYNSKRKETKILSELIKNNMELEIYLNLCVSNSICRVYLT